MRLEKWRLISAESLGHPPQPAAFIWQVPESTGPQGSAGAKLAMSPASCVAHPGLGEHRL